MTNGFGSLSLTSKRSTKSQKPQPAVDAAVIQQQWLSQFAELDDPRGRKGVEHAFMSIVIIAILATIGGATGWEDIEVYAESTRLGLAPFWT